MLISMMIVAKSKWYIPPPPNSENSGDVYPKDYISGHHSNVWILTLPVYLHLYSCGHLYHASCVGIAPHNTSGIGLTCLVCNKSSAPPAQSRRLLSEMVSFPFVKSSKHTNLSSQTNCWMQS